MTLTPQIRLPTPARSPAVKPGFDATPQNGRRQTAVTGNAEPNRAAVQMQIDELVLHGFATSQRHAIKDAVEQELTRQLSLRRVSAPDADRSIPFVDAGRLSLSNELTSAEIGRRIAKAILGGMLP